MRTPPPDQIHALLERALAGGGRFAEVYLELSASVTLTFDDGRLDRTAAGLDQGAGLRVVDGSVTHFANSNDLSAEGLAALADRLAAGVGRRRECSAATLLPAASAAPTSVERWPDEVSVSERTARLELADRVARGFDPRVIQVTASLGTARKERLIANSEGRCVTETTPYATFSCSVVARGDGLIRSGYRANSATRGWEFLAEREVTEIASNAARVACLQLRAAPAPSGTMTVVLGSKAGGTMVHEACGHGLEADFFLKRLSIYSGRLGEQVASPKITVVDDGTVDGRRGTQAFDDEGTPTQRVVLIERGRLVGLLQSRHTAGELAMLPTGNGRRESYRHLPLPRMRNTFIAPGTESPEAIVASVEDGLFVAEMGGGQVDIVSGNFVFHCTEAYRIRNGLIAEPVRDAMLTGNGPEVLLAIDRVGSDLGWAVGTCGKDDQGVPVADAQPTLRIPAVVVGGADPAP